MAEFNIKLTGPSAIATIAALAILVVYRIFSFAQVQDPALEEAVREQLHTKALAGVSMDLESFNPEDYSAADEAAAEARVRDIATRSNAENIDIHSMYVSKPLLSLGGDVEVVVKVDYSLPGESRQTGFFRFEGGGLFGGYRYGRRSSELSYYLNFF